MNLQKATRWLPAPIREVLLLERAEQAAQAYSTEQREKIRTLAVAAECRRRAADSLSEEDQLPVATLLDRDAAKLMMAAVLVAKGIDVDTKRLDGTALTTSLLALVESGALAEKPVEIEQIRAYFSDANELELDALPLEETAARRTLLRRAFDWLRLQFEARSPQQIVIARYLRLGAVAFVLVGLVVWGIVRAASDKNLALHKPVIVSSQCPASLNPYGPGFPGFGPPGLVDGEKRGKYDMCTGGDTPPWVAVDLTRVARLSKVVVYNRGDCCFDHSLPMVVELSLDGTSYHEVGRHPTPLGESDPWSIPVKEKARYVRLKVDSPTPKSLVLSELEVYGH